MEKMLKCGGRNYSMVFFLTVSTLGSFLSFSQNAEIPIGTWRMHLSYNNIIALTTGGNKVYGATEMGILVFDKSDNSISSYNKITGLTGSGITAIEYDALHDQLIVAYEDGNIDFIKDDIVTNFTRLRDLNTVSGSHRINHISVNDNLAYFATDYGVVVFDPGQREIKETWRDLGRAGENIRINKSVLYKDSIVLATSNGVLIGSPQDNLLDFSQWKRFDAADLSGNINSIAGFNEKLYVGIDGKGIYLLSNGIFIPLDILQDMDFSSMEGSADNLVISTNDKLWIYTMDGQIVQVADDEIQAPGAAIEESGVYWIGDGVNGLVSNSDGAFNSYIPNGPSETKISNLEFGQGRIFALSETLSPLMVPAGTSGVYNYFQNGIWAQADAGVSDLTDIAVADNNLYFSSFGKGVVQQDPSGSVIVFDETNSPLENISTSGDKKIFIPNVESSESGLWVANYGASKPLHLLHANTWQSFPLNYSQGMYPLQLVIDFSQKVWMSIDPARGGGIIVLNPSTGENQLLTGAIGGGGLPDAAVRSLAVDLEGNVWVGTDAGVGYFFSETEDIIKPIFENRFLLKDEKITSIAIDGGNRKWMGTEKGVWLFNPQGDELVFNFTKENSPLLSNVIKDIAIHEQTGEVFFSTDKGIISFRGDATASEKEFRSVKIFPNPVMQSYSGMVGISGLATDAFVKITDVTGKLVSQFRANGGTATWDVRDTKGRRATTGIYLVFAATEDGSDSMVGKIAVIE